MATKINLKKILASSTNLEQWNKLADVIKVKYAEQNTQWYLFKGVENGMFRLQQRNGEIFRTNVIFVRYQHDALSNCILYTVYFYMYFGHVNTYLVTIPSSVKSSEHWQVNILENSLGVIMLKSLIHRGTQFHKRGQKCLNQTQQNLVPVSIN